MNKSEQPVAIVTGASSGIGLGITQALLERGWSVVGTPYDQQVEGPPGISPPRPGGRRSQQEGDRRPSYESGYQALRPDRSAGEQRRHFVPKPFTDYTEDDYNLVMNTNVASMFFMSQQVIPEMKQQHSGHVVNISATLADQPAGGVPAFLAILSKSPMPAVSKALALEFAADNIRFNTVSPGVVNTPMHANEDHSALAKFHPLNRIAETSDIVDAVLYLQNATFVTGENIHVDGGFHAGR